MMGNRGGIREKLLLKRGQELRGQIILDHPVSMRAANRNKSSVEREIFAVGEVLVSE